MVSPKLRHGVRAVLLDEGGRVLLCRCEIPGPEGVVVWITPGGGAEPGETPLAALRRELREEVGFEMPGEPPLVWCQRVVAPGHAAAGYDGVANDYYLVRTPVFEPRGAFSDAELAAENISGTRWWHLDEIAAYDGTELFSPRDLAGLLADLLGAGVPSVPVWLGL
ncbi:NUDIX domain-containing protein [Streptomyces sp. NPDC004539]|uniref:NUDIX domain-containing protein n=1 Tax=Streptomyces sp. NPDC004539 TaxID=3154280 RepID=UPI0033A04FB9